MKAETMRSASNPPTEGLHFNKPLKLLDLAEDNFQRQTVTFCA